MRKRAKGKFYKNSHTPIPVVLRGIYTQYPNSTKYIAKVTQVLRNQIMRQLNFRPKARGFLLSRNIISKEIGDELVVVTKTLSFHLIKCRSCNKLSKADLDTHRKCRRCAYYKVKDPVYRWGMWTCEV